MFLLMLLRAISSSTYTFGKAGLAHAEPLFFLATRSLLGAALLLSISFFIKRNISIAPEDRFSFFKQGFFQIFLGIAPAYVALQYMKSSKLGLIYTLTPFFTAIFSYFNFNEKITLKKGLGFFIGFIGILPVLLLSSQSSDDSLIIFSWPEMVALCSTASYAYGWVIARDLIKRKGYASDLSNGLSLLIGGILTMISSLMFEIWDPIPASNMQEFLPILFTITVIFGLGLYVYSTFLKKYTATFLMFITFIDPLYVALYGYLFLGESVSRYFFVSVFAVTIGLYIFYKEDTRLAQNS